MKFRLTQGTHYEAGKRHDAPATVESARPLHEIFPRRFQLIEEQRPFIQEDVVQLKAVHKGAGRWNVINTSTGEPINDGWLDKEEAKEMADE